MFRVYTNSLQVEMQYFDLKENVDGPQSGQDTPLQLVR